MVVETEIFLMARRTTKASIGLEDIAIKSMSGLLKEILKNPTMT